MSCREKLFFSRASLNLHFLHQWSLSSISFYLLIAISWLCSTDFMPQFLQNNNQILNKWLHGLTLCEGEYERDCLWWSLHSVKFPQQKLWYSLNCTLVLQFSCSLVSSDGFGFCFYSHFVGLVLFSSIFTLSFNGLYIYTHSRI